SISSTLEIKRPKSKFKIGTRKTQDLVALPYLFGFIKHVPIEENGH
ncbi:12752_t:CDS:1, partial [Gigaspora rosea]